MPQKNITKTKFPQWLLYSFLSDINAGLSKIIMLVTWKKTKTFFFLVTKFYIFHQLITDSELITFLCCKRKPKVSCTWCLSRLCDTLVAHWLAWPIGELLCDSACLANYSARYPLPFPLTRPLCAKFQLRQWLFWLVPSTPPPSPSSSIFGIRHSVHVGLSTM